MHWREIVIAEGISEYQAIEDFKEAKNGFENAKNWKSTIAPKGLKREFEGFEDAHGSTICFFLPRVRDAAFSVRKHRFIFAGDHRRKRHPLCFMQADRQVRNRRDIG